MKLPEFHERDFDEQTLRCPNCHWQGEGRDAVIIDFFGVVKNQEVHCPNCDETLAILIKDGGAPGGSASDLSFQTG